MENNVPYFENNRRPKRPVKWIMLVCALLAVGCIVVVSSLNALPFAPPPAPTPTPTPQPTVAPTPTIEPTIEPVATAEPEPTPQADYDTTAIIIDSQVMGALASLEAAEDVLDNAISFFELKITSPGTLVSETANQVELVSANTLEGVVVYSYEDMLAILTGEKTPLKVLSTLKEVHTDVVAKDVKSEKDKNLIKGTYFVAQYGSDGKTNTVTTTHFINGEVDGKAETETFELSSRVDMLIYTGTASVEKGSEPNKKQGAKGPDKGDISFNRPTKGEITLNYGQRNGILHLGLDFAAKDGDDVLAAADGEVVCIMQRGGYGLVVELAHGNGFLTRYAHLSTTDLALGDTVTQGQIIAKAGSSGNCQKPHLHFELRCDGIAYNPRYYFD